jgi:predicted dithiol-disulfide oxidoreductase (DUF899 family)
MTDQNRIRTGARMAAETATDDHRIATREEWLAARAELLVREKEHTRRGDELARQRADLPWLPVEKDYTLQTADGRKTLPELFAGRSQLAVYHFMFGPEWEAGCPVCSSIADSFNGVLPHLAARDVTMLCISQAPLEKLLAYRGRMGWSFEWASSYESDFNVDFEHTQSREAVSGWATELPDFVDTFAAACGTDRLGYFTEGPGLSVFARSGDDVYLTYATRARGLEIVMGYYPILDRVPLQRDEAPPLFNSWIHRHDEYDAR